MDSEARDFDGFVKPGDAVDEEIANHFLNSVPPVSFQAGYIQCGEAYNHVPDDQIGMLRATYATFTQHGDRWRYCGHCFKGETTHRE